MQKEVCWTAFLCFLFPFHFSFSFFLFFSKILSSYIISRVIEVIVYTKQKIQTYTNKY